MRNEKEQAYDSENFNANNRRDPVQETRMSRKRYIRNKAAGLDPHPSTPGAPPKTPTDAVAAMLGGESSTGLPAVAPPTPSGKSSAAGDPKQDDYEDFSYINIPRWIRIPVCYIMSRTSTFF